MNDMNIIGQRIRFYRNKLGLTQSELAKKTGCTQGAIVAYECGKRTPSLIKGYLVAKALGITVDQLVEQKVVIEI